ncbi:PspA/IM30 family protein [Persicobacter psychrovividus]|uniref:Phage shock protein A n=1 Tax=Persicobacter psychrovividus TaxID=387638 RepID=A0ABN6LCL1_9BACT|nr:hypothetical protein PEPS_14270 [Persicobacter psychrovividus]
MNIFKRLFRIGSAEAHSAVDKLENPIKMTEQGIRDLKKDLDSSLQALAEVKAMQIRARNDVNNFRSKSKDYENKAMLVIQKAQAGSMTEAEADELAAEILSKKAEIDADFARATKEKELFDQKVPALETNVKKLRSNISQWENELKTLKARVKVSESTQRLNKQMANIDSSSTVAMLEKMKTKVDENEALAEAYGDIADSNESLDSKIDSALGAEAKGLSALEELKAKMNKGN